MKLLIMGLLCMVSVSLIAQNSSERTLVTDDGTFVVKTNRDAKSYITFTAAQLAAAPELRDTTGDSPNSKIAIRIATRKTNCKNQIGFRCGFIEIQLFERNSGETGRFEDRQYPITKTKNDDGSLTITFETNVDWDWLSN